MWKKNIVYVPLITTHDQLLVILRASGFGCHIHGVFFGAMVFADDIMLLSASRSGLQTLVDLCQEFASGKTWSLGQIQILRSLRPSVLSSAKARRIGWMFQQLCWMVMHSHGSLKLSILEMFSKVTYNRSIFRTHDCRNLKQVLVPNLTHCKV